MSKPKVFVTRRIPQIGLAKLQEFCDVDLWTHPLPPSRADLLERVGAIEGLLSLLTERIDEELLDAAPNLKVVSNYAVGFNNIDIKACTERGIRVGNTPGVLTDATADLAVALMLAAARRVVEGHRYSLSGAWKTWEPLGHIGQDLVGRTVGIVGMGRIGHAFAKRCRGGWGMRVLYHDVNVHQEAERELGARRVEFDTLLAESDFVSVHADLNSSTQGMFNALAFRRMKNTAVFVNTARGGLHNHEDLVHALKSGEIFAAGLDVTDPEPPDVHDELLKLQNVVLTPHIASATVSSRNAMADIAADNLIAGLQGKPLRCWVNPIVAER